jgi:methylamine dehydrogenase accessory protein MauD
MSGVWLASYVVLWAVVLFQGLVIFILLRQLGLMYLGTARGVAHDGLALGESAPDFTLRGLKGQTISLADFRGLPLVLVFGSPNCVPCRALVPDLNSFARERSRDLHVLFLSRGGLEDARRFAGESGLQVSTAIHPDDELANTYKVRVTPFAFLISSEGTIRAKGLANNREHLDMLLRTGSGASRNGAGAEKPLLAKEEVR